jgi:hypothetical protein
VGCRIESPNLSLRLPLSFVMPIQVWRLLALAVCVVATVAATRCGLAQPQGNWIPPDAEVFEEEGTVAGVAPTGLQMLTKEANTPWIVQITRQSEVKVTGTAEPSFLRPGLAVRFTAEVDEKGHLQQDLAELEIVTASGKGAVGVFAVGAEENARPVGKLVAGAYEIRGKVVSLREGELTVQAGKKIVGKLADDAKITVNVQDLAYAVPESEVSVQGFYFRRMAPDPNTQRPGQAMAKMVHVTLAKPLVGKAKAASKPGRPGKPKPTDTPEAADVNLDDPFGVEKK